VFRGHPHVLSNHPTHLRELIRLIHQSGAEGTVSLGLIGLRFMGRMLRRFRRWRKGTQNVDSKDAVVSASRVGGSGLVSSKLNLTGENYVEIHSSSFGPRTAAFFRNLCATGADDHHNQSTSPQSIRTKSNVSCSNSRTASNFEQ